MFLFCLLIDYFCFIIPMSTGLSIKKIRAQKELTQQTITDLIAMHRSNYSKIKNGQRELSIDALKKIVKYFGIATDQFINYENGIPTEVTTENKTLLEQVKLILRA